MTGPDADKLGARLSIHLRRNHFGICQTIITEAEEKYKCFVPGDAIAIAELPIDLRMVNLLEKEGFLYLSQVESMDLNELLSIAGLGPKCISALGAALDRVKISRAKTERERYSHV